MNHKYINKSYQLGLINAALILIALLSILFLNKNIDINAFLVGLPIFLAGVLSINGCRYLFVGRREKKDYKFYIALIFNMSIAALFILFIIGNVIDMLKAFS